MLLENHENNISNHKKMLLLISKTKANILYYSKISKTNKTEIITYTFQNNYKLKKREIIGVTSVTEFYRNKGRQ